MHLQKKHPDKLKPSSVSATNGNAVFFQSKHASSQGTLSINQPSDVYEQEADVVADKLMHTSTHESSFFKPALDKIQRMCAHCEEEKMIHRKEINNDTPVDAPTENYIHSLSGGQRLNAGDRQFFESRMGYDLSDVRLHTDSAANASAKTINAKAYTHANDIVFGEKAYRPETGEGKRLLAHELTHVVQQQAVSSIIQRERELDADESKECLQKVDDAIKELETAAADTNKNLPDYIKEAIKVVKEKRQQGKVKCYAFDGTKHGRVDLAKDEIHYDGVNKDQINTTTVLHEAVHASHGKQHPTAAKEYGKSVGKDIDPSKKSSDLDLLKWKAWTEYWAYRSSQDFYNDKQKRSEEDIHNTVMKIKEVDVAVRNVRIYDQSFDPSKWNPK